MWGGRVNGVLRAPVTAAVPARVTRDRVRSFRPYLVYAWGIQTAPHAAPAVVGAEGVPLAYRLAVPWAGAIYTGDRFMRYLGPPGRRRDGLDRAAHAKRSTAYRGCGGTGPRGFRSGWRGSATRCDARSSSRPPWRRFSSARCGDDGPGRTGRRAPAPPADRPTIAYAGRVLPEKGLDVAYRVLALLHSDHGVAAPLIVAGRCPRNECRRLDALAQELRIGDHVDLRGPLEGAELDAIYQGAHLVVIPSVWWEPLPLHRGRKRPRPGRGVARRRYPRGAARRRGGSAVRARRRRACATALADVFARPDDAARRVERAFQRARDAFSLESCLAGTDRLLADAIEALAGARRPVAAGD